MNNSVVAKYKLLFVREKRTNTNLINYKFGLRFFIVRMHVSKDVAVLSVMR